METKRLLQVCDVISLDKGQEVSLESSPRGRFSFPSEFIIGEMYQESLKEDMKIIEGKIREIFAEVWKEPFYWNKHSYSLDEDSLQRFLSENTPKEKVKTFSIPAGKFVVIEAGHQVVCEGVGGYKVKLRRLKNDGNYDPSAEIISFFQQGAVTPHLGENILVIETMKPGFV
ncbi:MAG: hypothetical protein LBO09_02175 [Candidatus Peribacteria bacterium]|nr:hypothetical protein [Candidatus Peribacteria bacterium]